MKKRIVEELAGESASGRLYPQRPLNNRHRQNSAAKTTMKTIAIIGNSGTNARPWTEAFLAAGWQVRNLVRAPQAVASPPKPTPAAVAVDPPDSHGPAL